MNIDKDLVAASATPLVLAILSEGESYGYAIIKRVGELSGGELQWTDGMVYPLLHRLDQGRCGAALPPAPPVAGGRSGDAGLVAHRRRPGSGAGLTVLDRSDTG
jgi:hypothetical protein